MILQINTNKHLTNLFDKGAKNSGKNSIVSLEFLKLKFEMKKDQKM